MKCPYAEIQCAYLDTAGMDKPIECNQCPHYKQPDKDGIVATGATPFLAWIINKWKYRKIKREYPSKFGYHLITLEMKIQAWINHFLRFRTFTKDKITIQARRNKLNENCKSCFFSMGIKGNDCNEKRVEAFGVPDCVYDYPIGHSVIYEVVKNKTSGKRGRTSEDPHQLMYECTCNNCGRKFSSSVPGFTCCPSCYA